MEEKDKLVIRFNKKYNKLEGLGNKVKLLFAGYINLSTPELHGLYDELLKESCMVGVLPYFPSFGEYVLCILQGDESKKMITHLVPFTDDNVNKYFRNVGKEFEVIVNDK